MSWNAAITMHGFREFCAGVINHGAQDNSVMLKTRVLVGVLFIPGTYYCFFACKDICQGNITSGLKKGLLGALAISHGLYHFINIWQQVADDATALHCRKWSHANGLYNLYIQDCTSFDCSTPRGGLAYCSLPDGGNLQQCTLFKIGSITPLDFNRCPWIKQDMGTKGFANVNEMQRADLR